MTRFEFAPEWRTTVFVAVLLPVLIGLGCWQLARAQEKAALAATFATRQAQAPRPLALTTGMPEAGLAYLPVRLRGHYRQGQYLLLDNRMRGGQFGNEVVAVFERDDGGVVLVNRGWLAADPARRAAPVVPEVVGDVTLVGHVYVMPGEPWLLGEQILATGWPKTVQALDLPGLAPLLVPDALYPYPVRLDAGQPGALQAEWIIVNVSPEKHTGYAVQWFLMAAVLALMYLLRSSNLWQLLRKSTNS